MKKIQIISLLFMATCLCSFKTEPKKGEANANSNEEAPATPQSFTSGTPSSTYLIPVDSANKMLKSYLMSIGADVDSGQTQNLQSLILDAETIREYLSNTSIKKVKVMFAHTLDYINAGNQGINCGYKPGKLTIILAGYDETNNYIFAPGNKVPDRAGPCPTACPSSGTASDMYLH